MSLSESTSRPVQRADSIRAVLARNPATSRVFEKHGLLGCGGPGGPDERIDLFAAVHRVDLEGLLSELNRAAAEQETPASGSPATESALYRPFLAAALLATLTLGATFGAYNLLWTHLALGPVPPAHNWIHGAFQLWGFVSPALRARERRVAAWVLAAGPVFFLGGFLFSFFKLMPLTALCLLRVSYYYGFVPRWTAESYYGFFLVLNLAFAACFELPLLMVILSAAGLVRPEVYGRYRRHWVVASFVIGGLLPPPEVVSMFIQAGVLILLYEVGILFSRLFVARQDPPQP